MFCRHDQESASTPWFAKVLAFFDCRGELGSVGKGPYAFVHWYTEAAVPKQLAENAKLLNMSCLKLCTDSERSEAIFKGMTDIIPVRDIKRPVLLQPMPGTKLIRWFWNHYVV